MSNREESLAFLKEALAPQLKSLAELLHTLPDRGNFIPYPEEPEAHTLHENTHTRYPLGCYRLRDMLLVGAHALFVTRDQRILREQNAETRVEESYTCTPRPMHPGIGAFSSVLSLVSAASYNFYHWVIDSLPKVIVAEACGFTGTYLLPTQLTNPSAAEYLEILGIPAARIAHPEHQITSVQELWLPTHFHGHRMEDTPLLHARFRRTILDRVPALTGALPRVYVRRRPPVSNRLVVNEPELLDVLSSFGFVVAELETLTPRQQIALMASASILCGVHGAGMLHSLWMPSGSIVIEFLPSNYQNPCMAVHSRLLGHRYVPIIVPNEDPRMHLAIDCPSLRSTLTSILQ